MSFDLYVFVKDFPSETVEMWRQELWHLGLACEFYPGFQTVDKWPGGILPIKVKCSGEYVKIDSVQSLLAEIEFDVEHNLNAYEWVFQEDNLVKLPQHVKQRLMQAQKMACFSTSAGRNVVDLHVQCFAAATLTFLCNGVLYDPQSEEYRVDDDLFEGAKREIEVYEPSKSNCQLRYFQSWERHLLKINVPRSP